MRDTSRGPRPQCYGCLAENHLKFTLKTAGYLALPWMLAAARALFGSIDADTGLRNYRKAYISTAKKQGKSFFVGWMPLFHLQHEPEWLDPDPLVVGAATTRKQASEVFDSAVFLINRNPGLQSTFEVVKSSKTIFDRRRRTRYEVLSADGDRNDGLRRSLGIGDEIHRFRSPKEEGILDAIERGGRGRKQPLYVKITTAGDPTESKIWLNEYNYAKAVRDGTIKDPKYFALIYEADPDKLRNDPEYWKSKEARIAANPSHEDLGGFITDEELRADLAQAIQIPTERRKYIRYTLNAMSESEDKLFAATDWEACSAEPAPFTDRACFAGLDLSSTTDLSALVFTFPDGEHVDVLPFFFCPKDRVPAIAKMLGPMGGMFRQWVTEGLIETTDGNAVDYAAIANKLEWARQNFRVLEIDYDPWNATQLMQQMTDAGWPCVKIPQGTHLSGSIKHLQKLVLERKVRHGGNKVLAWMASCAKAHQDPNENFRLIKSSRNQEVTRIDGVAALLNAMSRVMVLTQRTSVYAEGCAI